MLKKGFSILLTAVVIFLATGYFGVFVIARYHVRSEIKKEIKKGIPDHKLEKIIFTDEESKSIQWKKKGREFILNGQMYDVVRTEKTAAGICYHCIQDVKETSLYKCLDNNVSNTANSKGRVKAWMKYFSFAGYFIIKTEEKQMPFDPFKWLINNESLSSGYRVVLYPPPKTA